MYDLITPKTPLLSHNIILLWLQGCCFKAEHHTYSIYNLLLNRKAFILGLIRGAKAKHSTLDFYSLHWCIKKPNNNEKKKKNIDRILCDHF